MVVIVSKLFNLYLKQKAKQTNKKQQQQFVVSGRVFWPNSKFPYYGYKAIFVREKKICEVLI